MLYACVCFCMLNVSCILYCTLLFVSCVWYVVCCMLIMYILYKVIDLFTVRRLYVLYAVSHLLSVVCCVIKICCLFLCLSSVLCCMLQVSAACVSHTLLVCKSTLQGMSYVCSGVDSTACCTQHPLAETTVLEQTDDRRREGARTWRGSRACTSISWN